MTDTPDFDTSGYFAAKEAWEREHPGEVYTTDLHYTGGPSARVLTDIWEQYDEDGPLACFSCDWEGAVRDGSKGFFDELFDVSCPECGEMLLIVNHPTIEQTRAAAERGNAAAQKELQGFEE